MSVREMLETFAYLHNSCLTHTEKKSFLDMLYKYKKAFSLGNEIGTCPSIVADIKVTGNSPFFVRPFHVKEDKPYIDDTMNRLLQILEY